MKSEFVNKEDSIGVDNDTAVSVVKLKENFINLIGVNKGVFMPVVQLGNDLSSYFSEVHNDLYYY